MYCKNCGNSIKENENFCTNCGTKINKVNLESDNQGNLINNDINSNNINNLKKSEKKLEKNLSIVLGIVSLILLFFTKFSIPLSILGIILGIIAFRENKKYKIGLILNIISLVIRIILSIISIFITLSMTISAVPYIFENIINFAISENAPIGTWDCKPFSSSDPGNYENINYVSTMILDSDSNFEWNKYNDAKDNHVIGTYSIEKLDKTNENNSAYFYRITLKGDEYVDNGIIQDNVYETSYEMAITDSFDEAVLVNEKSYNMYYCYKNNNSK